MGGGGEIPAPLRVVLDCDTANEVDDQFAIAHALGSPEGTLDVRGVVSVHNTTAHGPLSRDLYQEEAERVVGLCGRSRDVPCVPGAPHPLEDRRTPVESEGLEFLVEEARRGPLTIFATGPATDVASLLLAAPEVRENLRIVWLGGFGDRESYERHKMGGELNGRADIAAWRVLFEEPVGMLQVPGWSGPHGILVEASSYAEELRALGRPVADYLAQILVEWVSSYIGEIDPRGEKIVWDVSCVAAVADPGALRVEELAVPALDAAGAHDFSEGSRGRTVEAVTGLDPQRILASVRDALLRHPASPGA
ncbi:MAG: nucleoside hydrolase [Rubrobacter sp.]|nr:nucleoside hydrolase [Rubrobacter sp.]